MSEFSVIPVKVRRANLDALKVGVRVACVHLVKDSDDDTYLLAVGRPHNLPFVGTPVSVDSARCGNKGRH